MRRVLRMKMFLGSTTEEIDIALAEFLERELICVGNYVDAKLSKLGNVYQLIFVYAGVVTAVED
jgi:hypothetical protein